MAQRISKNDICIISGDPIRLLITTQGSIRAVVGDTAKFIIKKELGTTNVVYEQTISVSVNDKIDIYVPSSITKNLQEGKFYWSLKHYSNGDEYVIIPDSATCSYPTFTIGSDLFDN